MNLKQFASILLVGAIAGLIGGGISQRLFAPQLAIAETDSKTIIKAHEFHVLNEKGESRGRFTIDPLSKGTTAHLVINGRGDGTFLSLSGSSLLGGREPEITVLGKNTMTKISGDHGGLVVSDNAFKDRIWLGLYKNDPTLALLEQDGVDAAVKLGVSDKDPYVAVFAEDSKASAQLLCPPGGGPVLQFKDKEGKKRVALGHVTVMDTNTEATITTPGSLYLFNSEGSTIWDAP